MKKYLKMALITMACSNLLMADMVFNLGAQQFSNSIEGNFKDSTYDLDNTIVSTPLKFDKGHYIPNVSGSFKIQLKELKSKWGVIFDIDSYLNIRGFGVTLLGKEGNILSLFFSNKKISVNGQVIEDSAFGGNKKIIGSIQSDGNTIKVLINAKHTFNIKKSNFKLAYVEVNLGQDDFRGYPQLDKLNGIAISTSSE
jgi:hypothetical protein